MKQNSKVIVVLVVIVVAFLATTLGGLRWSDKRDEDAEDDLRTKGPRGWVSWVGNWLPSPMPSIDLSTCKVVKGTLEGVVLFVGTRAVTIGVPASDEPFRQADLSLLSGPPVGVHVTGGDATYAQTPESEEDSPKDKQKVRVTISDKGGTIELRQPPVTKDGDIELKPEPKDDETVPTPEPQDDETSRVRFGGPPDGACPGLDMVSYSMGEGAIVAVGQASVTIEVPSSEEDDEDSPRFRRADLCLWSGPPVGVYVKDKHPTSARAYAQDRPTPQSDKRATVIISDKGGTIELRQPPVPEDGDIVLTREPHDGEVSRVLFE